MEHYSALILAAGKGTRMKSELCKVLHQVAGKPMISYVLEAVGSCGFDKMVLVLGHQAESVKESVSFPSLDYAVQEPQLGTGHAVLSARHLFDEYPGNVLVLCGDTPLIQPTTIKRFVEFHEETKSRLSLITARPLNPHGYGRIIRNESGRVIQIVEERDASDSQRLIDEVNTGIYMVERALLFSLLEKIKANNSQQEYYLTDIVTEAIKISEPVNAYLLDDFQEALGINTRAELAAASTIIWNKTRRNLMESGVTLLDPCATYVAPDVTIGRDTVIHPGTNISGATRIGANCLIESGVYIIDSQLGDGVKVLQGSRLVGAVVNEGTSVGPMAHIRPGTVIGRDARIGNFVEVKKTVVGDGTKASHLTYLGDSVIGKKVNIGCGTITCNYDGKKKHPTIIGDGCFVGSDVQFVAPVEIGEGSVIGAGSTITHNVPPRSLAVSRSKQRTYPLRKGQGSAPSDENRES
jgi:bifunctional UDP-N-acetylglucosamine pyrophosphorylase / glucosamine-1-phosphate N-acetyltransferase